jgi:para-nitrobenzyl esterase
MFGEPEAQSENCLFLNMWTPGLDDAHRPVMFWIHGGAFIVGSGSEPAVRGGKLAAYGDIVLVSINYRLGALGFMNLNEITGGKIPATGNEGLLDQIAALQWVHDNIAAFGGDPANVTAFGFSAGAMSIGDLLAMPSARGTFHKAIHHSGAANVVGPLEGAVKTADGFVKVLGLNGRDVAGLRSLSTDKILWAQQELGNKFREAEHRITPYMPVVDGRIIPDWPIITIKGGSAKNIPVLAGTALEEWKLMAAGEPGLTKIDEDGLARRLVGLAPPEHLPRLIEAYRNALKKRGNNNPYEILTAIQTDVFWRMPTIQVVEAQRDNQQLAYNFLFTLKSPLMNGFFGACHGMDFNFVFGNYEGPLCGSGPELDALSRQMQDAWLAFARTGDPSCESIGKWPVYGDKRLTMILDKRCRVEAAPYEEERLAWDKIDLIYTRPI